MKVIIEADAIHELTLVMPELENGSGNAILIDLLVKK